MIAPMDGRTRYGLWCRPKLADLLGAVGLDVEYTRASGAYLYRNVDGHEEAVLDLVGGFGAGLFGHNHPELKATLHYLLDQDTPFLAQSAIRGEAGRLAERLSALLPGSARYLSHFSNDGAGAIEAVLKHAYKVRFDALRRIFDRISRDIEAFHREYEGCADTIVVPGGRDLNRFRDDLDEYNIAALEHFQHQPVVLALKGAFHGKTSGALRLTFNKTYREGFEGLSAIQTVFLDPADLHRLEEIVAEHQITFRHPVVRDGVVSVATTDYSAVILLALEVIQGEGGIRPVPDDALAAVAASVGPLALPCLVDEIQSGFGRTGFFVAYADTPLAAIHPEYVTLSKALGGGLCKIGVAMIRDDVYDDDFGVLHTSTFAEDELACGVANRAIDLLTEHDDALMQRVRDIGKRLLTGLRVVAARHPGVIREVRGRGLMIGVEFTDLSDKVTAVPVRHPAGLPLPAGGELPPPSSRSSVDGAADDPAEGQPRQEAACHPPDSAGRRPDARGSRPRDRRARGSLPGHRVQQRGRADRASRRGDPVARRPRPSGMHPGGTPADRAARRFRCPGGIHRAPGQRRPADRVLHAIAPWRSCRRTT